RISNLVRCSPRPSEAPERPTPPSPLPFLRLNSGILSPSALSTLGPPSPFVAQSGDRQTFMGATAVIDARLDLEHKLDEIRPRLDLDRARARYVDVEHGGDTSGPRRHDGDAVGEKDRLGNGMGNEDDGLAGLHP